MTPEIHDFFENYLNNNVGELSEENRNQITAILENKKVRNNNLLPAVQQPKLTQYRKMAKMADEDTKKIISSHTGGMSSPSTKEDFSKDVKVSESSIKFRNLVKNFEKTANQDLGLEQDINRGQEQSRYDE